MNRSLLRVDRRVLFIVRLVLSSNREVLWPNRCLFRANRLLLFIVRVLFRCDRKVHRPNHEVFRANQRVFRVNREVFRENRCLYYDCGTPNLFESFYYFRERSSQRCKQKELYRRPNILNIQLKCFPVVPFVAFKGEDNIIG